MKHLFLKGYLAIMLVFSAEIVFAQDFDKDFGNKCKNQIINFIDVIDANTAGPWVLLAKMIDISLKAYLNSDSFTKREKWREEVRSKTWRLLLDIELESIKRLRKKFELLIVKNCPKKSIEDLDGPFKTLILKGNHKNHSFLRVVWDRILQRHKLYANVFYKVLCSGKGRNIFGPGRIISERVCVGSELKKVFI